MKSANSIIVSCVISFWLMACQSLSEREQIALDALSQSFPEYEFSKLWDLSDAYLKVRLKEKTRIDTTKLRGVYEELSNIRNYKDGNGQPSVNWIYLVIYDTDNNYIFTNVENNHEILFFRDGTN